jgi:hypothetical protein
VAVEHIEALEYTAKGELAVAEIGHQRVEAEARAIQLRSEAEARASKLRSQMFLEEARAEAEALRLVSEARARAHTVATLSSSPMSPIGDSSTASFPFPAAPPPPIAVATHAVKHTYTSNEPGKLSVRRGAEVRVKEEVKGWAFAELMSGDSLMKGWVPSSYISPLVDAGPTVVATVAATGAGPQRMAYDEATPGFDDVVDDDTYL